MGPEPRMRMLCRSVRLGMVSGAVLNSARDY
jgi:hypothetical protein